MLHFHPAALLSGSSAQADAGHDTRRLPFEEGASPVVIHSDARHGLSMTFLSSNLIRFRNQAGQQALIKEVAEAFQSPQTVFEDAQAPDGRKFQIYHDGRSFTVNFKVAERHVTEFTVAESQTSPQQRSDHVPAFTVELGTHAVAGMTHRRSSSPDSVWRKRLRQESPVQESAAQEATAISPEQELPQFVSLQDLIVEAPLPALPPFVLPDAMKLSAVVRGHLDDLQKELDENPTKSQEDKNAGPGLEDLVKRLRENRLVDYTNDKSFENASLYLWKFDAYRKHQPEYLRLEIALADVCTFEGHIRGAKAYEKRLDTSCLAKLYAVFYPDTPARQKVQSLLMTRAEWADTNANRQSRGKYLNYGTAIDVCLASQWRHFADVCRLDGEGHEAENKIRAKRFIEMKDQMLKGNRDTHLQNFLKTLRLDLHPLKQDADLTTLIEGAINKVGASVAPSTKAQWKKNIAQLGEVLLQHDMDVQTFVCGLYEFADKAQPAKVNLQRFKEAEAPFRSSMLNYARMAAKWPSPNILDAFLSNILGNERMMQILPAPEQ